MEKLGSGSGLPPALLPPALLLASQLASSLFALVDQELSARNAMALPADTPGECIPRREVALTRATTLLPAQ